MKKILTLALVLTVGVVITGCTAESAKTSSTVVKTVTTPTNK